MCFVLLFTKGIEMALIGNPDAFEKISTLTRREVEIIRAAISLTAIDAEDSRLNRMVIGCTIEDLNRIHHKICNNQIDGE